MDTRLRSQSARASHSAGRRYERARAVLTLATLRLACSNTTATDLRDFIAAALALCDACDHDFLSDRPLDVLLWLRRRLNEEASKPGRSDVYRALCRREARQVECKIESACVRLSRGGLVALEQQGPECPCQESPAYSRTGARVAP